MISGNSTGYFPVPVASQRNILEKKMDKEKTAIMRLQEASQMSLAFYEFPLVITISGGKDSSVCLVSLFNMILFSLSRCRISSTPRLFALFTLSAQRTPVTINLPDSSVCLELAKRAKIPYEVVHNHTTADAPETVYFIRRDFLLQNVSLLPLWETSQSRWPIGRSPARSDAPTGAETHRSRQTGLPSLPVAHRPPL